MNDSWFNRVATEKRLKEAKRRTEDLEKAAYLAKLNAQFATEIDQKIKDSVAAQVKKIEIDRQYYKTWCKILVRESVRGTDCRAFEEWPKLIKELEND